MILSYPNVLFFIILREGFKNRVTVFSPFIILLIVTLIDTIHDIKKQLLFSTWLRDCGVFFRVVDLRYIGYHSFHFTSFAICCAHSTQPSLMDTHFFLSGMFGSVGDSHPVSRWAAGQRLGARGAVSERRRSQAEDHPLHPGPANQAATQA